VRRGLPALAALFLLAHLATLPRTFDDIDAINFSLGVRDFEVAQHQPHPPGYPLYIALGKISTPLVRAAGIAAPEVRGLAVWSAIGGAALMLLLFGLWRTLDGSPERAFMAAVLAAATPLFWFTSLRPLSDVPGLCLAVASLGLTLRALACRVGFGWRLWRQAPPARPCGGYPFSSPAAGCRITWWRSAARRGRISPAWPCFGRTAPHGPRSRRC
jgi:hypothetical protein